VYFLNEMSLDEISSIYNAKYEAEKQEWERARLICFYSVVASIGTKKIKKVTDLFTFSWEKKKVKNIPTKEELIKRFNG
jgi:hypothetical protein